MGQKSYCRDPNSQRHQIIRMLENLVYDLSLNSYLIKYIPTFTFFLKIASSRAHAQVSCYKMYESINL